MRLPINTPPFTTGLVPGPATVRVTNGAVYSTAPFNITVSATPSAPILHSVHSGSCSGGFNATATTMTLANAAIMVDVTGVDSNGGNTTFVWTPLTVGIPSSSAGGATCGGPSGRVYTEGTVPAYPAGTVVRLEIRTTSAVGGPSVVSNAILMTVEGSPEGGGSMYGASGSFVGGIVVPEGHAITALRGTISGGAIEGINYYGSPLAYPMSGGEAFVFGMGGSTGAAYDLTCPASMVMTGVSGSLTGVQPSPGNLTEMTVHCKTPTALSGPVGQSVGPVGTPSPFTFNHSCPSGKKLIIVQGQVSSIIHGIGLICR